MFERLFQWSMRHGARVLFAFAAILFALALAQSLFAVDAFKAASFASSRFGASPWQAALLGYGDAILMAFREAVLPLFAALVVNHLDRRWSQ